MEIEIERKFLIKKMPDDLSCYKSNCLTQAYLNTSPVVRIRKEDDSYYLTYKGGGLLAREEYNLPLNEASFYHLLEKADGNIISKTRYKIPYLQNNKSYTIELDIFDAPFTPLVIAEVEFSCEEEANQFIPPDWFGEDVTFDKHYHNSNMSQRSLD